MDNLIILPNHFNGKDTIIYNRWVMNGCEFFHMDNAQPILKAHSVPEEVWQQVLDAKPNGVKHSELLYVFAYRYCVEVQHEDAFRQMVADSGDPTTAYLYCKNISNDMDMRQVIINNRGLYQSLWYCKNVSNDPDMRLVIIDSDNPFVAKRYVESVSNDGDMRAIVRNVTLDYSSALCRRIEAGFPQKRSTS